MAATAREDRGRPALNTNKVRAEIVDRWTPHFRSKGVALNGESVSDRAQKIAAWMRTNTPKNFLAPCSTCGGESDVRLPECPFCGDGETIQNGDQVVSQMLEVEQTTEAERQLDRAVAKVRELKRQVVVCYWALGRAILEIYQTEVWRARRDETLDKPLYPTWSHFVEAELGVGVKHAYKMMGVGMHFTREDVEEIGSSKLMMLLPLSTDDRQRLLERAKTERLSQDSLAREIRRLAGYEAPKPTGREKAKPGEVVSVELPLQRGHVPLFARNKKAGPARRAGRIADDPHGTLSLPGGLELYVVLVQTRDGLRLDYEIRKAMRRSH